MKKILIFSVLQLLALQIWGQQEKSTDPLDAYETMEMQSSLPPGEIGEGDFWYRDGDTDGYGNPFIYTQSTTKPFGYVQNDYDCNDNDASIYIGAPETVDGKDNNCDGVIDNTTIPAIPSTVTITNNCGSTTLTRGTPPTGVTWYWQSISSGTSITNSSVSLIRTSGTVYYLRARDNSSLQWSSSRAIDYTITVATSWYGDSDFDGFGDPAVVQSSCTQPTGYVSNSNDLCPATSGIYSGCLTPQVSFTNENYFRSSAYQVPTTIATSSSTDKIQEITYFDGLGRPKQVVAVLASPDTKDLITHVDYNEFGITNRDYLPYSSSGTSGTFRSGGQLTNTQAFYKAGYPEDFINISQANTNPYSEKLVEASPLKRVLKQAAPGQAWKNGVGNEVEFNYEANLANEVRYYVVSLATGYLPSITNPTPTYYPAGQLYKTVTKDENYTGTTKDRTTEEFKDKLGRVVLKRTYNANISHDTYYVYDMYGNLTFIIPPLVNTADGISTTEMSDLCYQYKYDEKNRLIEKKIPGKGWEFIVYNKLDQPILTKDSNLHSLGKWIFTKYDAFGRVAYTGLATISNTTTRSTVQAQADAVTVHWVTKSGTANTIATTPVFYNNTAYPTTSISEIHTINYYDDYTFDINGGVSELSYGLTPGTSIKGLSAGSKVRILGTNQWITNVSYYDSKHRTIYTYSKNDFLGTTDKVKQKIHFTGRLEETLSTQTTTGSSTTTVTVLEKYFYDHMNRLLKQTHKINSGAEETIAQNQYNSLGQLVQKKVGNTDSTPLQVVDYSYNVRGWLRQINDGVTAGTDLFGFTINYNNPTTGTALYNGNISQTLWRTKNTDQNQRSYSYSYDALNRITRAISNDGKFDLGSSTIPVTYDKNGNITRLFRKGAIVASPIYSTTSHFGSMDDLIYTYSGNKLLIVSDAGNETIGFKDDNIGTALDPSNDYSYDINGNLISDANKGITSVLYNHLDMPTEVKFNGSNTQKINYTYSADGIKLRKATNNGGVISTTDYAGNFVYENNTLKQFNQEEGYVEPKGSGWQYVYQKKDIWGNIRLTYADDNNSGSLTSAEIRREQNYYPFGLEHKGYNTSSYGVKNNLKTFQGQEFTEDLGLNTHEWKYRMSDPSIGRFWQIDPLAEDYMYNSTYAFAENKLGMGIELEGAEIFTWLQQRAVVDAAVNPNGVGAHTLGVAQGLVNTVSGVVNAVSNPVQTLKGAGDAALWLAVGSQFSEQVDGALGTNSAGAGDAILNSVVEGGDNLINGNGIERGMVIGEIAGAVVGTKGINAVTKSSKGGIVYERLDNAGGLKPYVGQAKNQSRFLARQKEHARANPNSDFDFKIIDRGSSNGKFPTDLDIREQRALNSRGGPTNKSNPNGGTSNKKNVVKK